MINKQLNVTLPDDKAMRSSIMREIGRIGGSAPKTKHISDAERSRINSANAKMRWASRAHIARPAPRAPKSASGPESAINVSPATVTTMTAPDIHDHGEPIHRTSKLRHKIGRLCAQIGLRWLWAALAQIASKVSLIR